MDGWLGRMPDDSGFVQAPAAASQPTGETYHSPPPPCLPGVFNQSPGYCNWCASRSMFIINHSQWPP